MKIYLAADYARKDEMQGCRDVINSLGHKVVSRWIDNPDNVESMGIGGRQIIARNLSEGSMYSITDHGDLYSCDLFVLFTTGNLSRGGRHTELGMAIGYDKRIVIVGPRENVFHCHPNISHQFPTWPAFVIWFSKGWTN